MQFLIGLIPAPYRLLAGAIALAVAAALLVGLGHRWGAASVQAAWDKETIANQAHEIEAQENARALQLWWSKQYQGAIDERTKAEQDAAVARAAGDAAGQRLRDARSAFQRRLSEAPAAACRAAAGTVAGLLDECSARYRSVAAAARGHLADLKQCEQAWPRGKP